MDMVYILGPMGEDMKENGYKANNMGKDNMYYQMER